MALVGKRGRLFPGLLAAAFAATMACSIFITALALDSFLIRYDRGSVTTMLPGFVYASALILKLSLVEAAVLGVIAFATMANQRNPIDEGRLPLMAFVSIVLPALAPAIGTAAVLVTQTIIERPVGDTANYFARLSQIGVFAVIAVVSFAGLSGIVSLVRKERPIRFAVTGLIVSIVQLALFLYWQFYKFGFDQDRWNNV